MNSNPTRMLGISLMIFATSSLYSSQTQNSFQVQRSVGSQSSSSAELCSAPVTHASETQGVQVSAMEVSSCAKQKTEELAQLVNKFVASDDKLTDSFDLGMMAEQSGDLGLAAQYFDRAAVSGNEGALYYLPEFYEKYQNIFPDALKTRLHWLKKIAIGSWLPDEKACYKVALCYETGYGIEKDISKAFAWYKKAADEGDGRACYKVGLFYENGVSVKADRERAFRYFKKAAGLCMESPEWFAKTARKVAECYAAGYGVEKNSDAALHYAQLASKAFQLLQHE